MDVGQLTDLLLKKNGDLSALMEVAREQQDLAIKIAKIKEDISHQNQVGSSVWFQICIKYFLIIVSGIKYFLIIVSGDNCKKQQVYMQILSKYLLTYSTVQTQLWRCCMKLACRKEVQALIQQFCFMKMSSELLLINKMHSSYILISLAIITSFFG